MGQAEENQNHIASCGLYCGDCHGYSGKIPDLARDLRKELRESQYDKFAAFLSTSSFKKDLKEYETCYKLQFLEPVHGNAHIKNLSTIKKKGKKQFLSGNTLWYQAIKNK